MRGKPIEYDTYDYEDAGDDETEAAEATGQKQLPRTS